MLDQTKAPILETLKACTELDRAPFYVPGHKRGKGTPKELTDWLGIQTFQADLPELPELDNLAAPSSVIREAQELAAAAFGAKRSWLLVNGSTAGVMSSIVATCGAGDKIILPRNVHKSAISGLILSGAIPIFINPEYDLDWDIANGITPTAVAAALAEHPDAKAVMMVSPTYHGVCGDVASVAQLAHEHGIPLIVDEAHGAHLAFHPGLPTPALRSGADLAVQSIHKVLGAMTQASMLHLNSDRIDANRLHQSLQMVQSTSPSHLLMASLDAARRQMATQGYDLMSQTLQLAYDARNQIRQIPGLSVLEPPAPDTPGFFNLDPTRLMVRVQDLGMSGYEADEILHYKLDVTAELALRVHLTFIISLGNTAEDIDRLVRGFEILARDYANPHAQSSENTSFDFSYMPSKYSPAPMSPRDAFFSEIETVPIAQSVGRLSAELICPYPPGIPVLMPGEEITQNAIEFLQQTLRLGGLITGCSHPELKTVQVVK